MFGVYDDPMAEGFGVLTATVLRGVGQLKSLTSLDLSGDVFNSMKLQSLPESELCLPSCVVRMLRWADLGCGSVRRIEAAGADAGQHASGRC